MCDPLLLIVNGTTPAAVSALETLHSVSVAVTAILPAPAPPPSLPPQAATPSPTSAAAPMASGRGVRIFLLESGFSTGRGRLGQAGRCRLRAGRQQEEHQYRYRV